MYKIIFFLVLLISLSNSKAIAIVIDKSAAKIIKVFEHNGNIVGSSLISTFVPDKKLV